MRGKRQRAILAQAVAETLPERNRARCLVGIDPGTKTGFAVWDRRLKAFSSIETTGIYTAIKRLEELVSKEPGAVFVRLEDATKRTWFGETGKERLKGAGSVERDCAIWVEVLTALRLPFELVPPKELRAPNESYFKQFTGYAGRTSVHARDAAWLVFKM